MANPRKLALVGIGKIARDQHIPAIGADRRWSLTATVSRNAEVDGVPGFADLRGLFAEMPEVGCVSLALPPKPRFAYAAEALRAGKHVMIEKPPGATLSEVHILDAMAREAGVTLFASWHSRAALGVAPARDWLRGRQVTRLAIDWVEDVRQWHPGQDWVFDAGNLGVFDPGINALSILTEILPQPVHVAEADLEFPKGRETPIAADIRFAMTGDAEGRMRLDWRDTGPPTWQMTVETDDGVLTLAEGGAVLRIDGEDRHLDGPGEYSALYARFADLVDAGQSDVDLAPMRHVADAFTLGRRHVTDSFDW